MKIKEFCDRNNISPYTVRYYDKMGLFGTIHRQKTYRDFTEEDEFTLKKITILRNFGASIHFIQRLFEIEKKEKLEEADYEFLVDLKNRAEPYLNHINMIMNVVTSEISKYENTKE